MGGSGGGSSGTIAYPAYIQAFHTKILDSTGTETPANSFVDAFNAAFGNSPFLGAVSYDPNPEVSSATSGINAFNSAVTGLNFLDDFTNALASARVDFPLGSTPLDAATLYTTTLDTANVAASDIAADIAAMNTILTDQIEQEELPRFKAGMLNINAIHTSAFIIGEALIRASKDKALIKYSTDLQMKIGEQLREINARHALSYREITARLQVSYSEIDSRYKLSKRELDAKFYIHREELVRGATISMLGNLMKKVEFIYQHAHLNGEIRRMAIMAFKEQREEQLAIDEADGKWDIELFRYAGLLIASPSGGVAQGNEKKSRAVSALGGALSGAASGAVAGAAAGGIGAPVGAAIGAVAGVGLAFIQ
jgi:hypothetical protein